MPDVRVQVNEQAYMISCGDGEEDRVRALADYLDAHVQRLTADIGRIAESRLLMLAALNVCDELFSAREQLMAGGNDNPAIARLLDDAANRVQQLADTLVPEKAAIDDPQLHRA